MQTKIIKRLDAFKVRNAAPNSQRKLLLPLSLGASSSCLLHVLDQHLERQLSRTGRAGFELHVLYVCGIMGEAKATWQQQLDDFGKRYPQQQFHIVPIDTQAEDSVAWEKHLSTSESTVNSLSSLSHASPSSQTDLRQISLSKVIVNGAHALGCEGVLWGHTATRLAERVLAETAKGRGFGLPWLVKDGASPFGVDFIYPMRDLLKKEAEAFATSLGLVDIDAISKRTFAPVSSKNTSIDGLMEEFFKSVEKEYPSIVANVVRTSSKLQATEISQSIRCEFCNLPVETGRMGLVGWQGDGNKDVTCAPFVPEGLCYGCARSALNATNGK